MKTATLCVAVGIVLAAAACMEEEPPLTWEDFHAQAYVDTEGIYYVNGDEPAEDIGQLRAAYAAYLDSFPSDGIGSIRQGLVVNRFSGADDKWGSSAAMALTYCIAASGTGAFSTTEFSKVVAAMDGAAAAWEGAAKVNFTHVAGQDRSCTNGTNVVFNVRRECSGQFLATSFFPHSARANRQLRIDCGSFGNLSPLTLTGLLRHELGHTIGFRHEHTRPEAGKCFEDNNWRALTTYDSKSVMHYPQCNGTQTGDLVLTARDRTGAAALYGAP